MEFKRLNNKGDTILEILVALSIIILVSSAFYTSLNKTILNNKKNDIDIKMINIAQSETEYMKQSIKEDAISIKKNSKEYPFLIWDDNFRVYKGNNFTYKVTDDEGLNYYCNIVIKNFKLKNKADNKTNFCDFELKVTPESRKFSKRTIKIYTKVLGNFK